MNYFYVFMIACATIWPFIWLYHAMTYDIARALVKKLGRKGNYNYTVRHELYGWTVVRKTKP